MLRILVRIKSILKPFGIRQVTILFLFLVLFISAGNRELELQERIDNDEITFVFCGDLMQHLPQVDAARTGEEYDYSYCFTQLSPLWKGADYVIANLETTLATERFSGYPCFRSPWQLARDARNAGINVMVTANNHSCDAGGAGIERTIQWLDSLSIPHTGTFVDSASYENNRPLYLQKNKFKIALLNYTYGTNGIPIPSGRVVSLIDTTVMAQEIQRAKDARASHIITFLHWGNEYQTLPCAEQKELGEWLHRAGVDLVIGSHPHVVQPAEYYVEGDDTLGVTVYSLGNFISNQRERRTYGGLNARVTIRGSGGEQGKPSRYTMETWSNYVSMNWGGRKYVLIPEQMVDSLPENQQAEFRRLIEDHRF